MDRFTVREILEALGVDTRGLKSGKGGKYIYILCPFHDDSDPSFSIRTDGGGSWQCFGCSMHGPSMGRLIQKYEEMFGPRPKAREIWDKDLEPFLKAKGITRGASSEEGFTEPDDLTRIENELAKAEWDSREAADDRLVFEYEVLPEERYSEYRGALPPKYFLGRGLEKRTCDFWDLGDDHGSSRALLPIRDFQGNLVGVQGRLYATDCTCGFPFDRWADDPRAEKTRTGKVKRCPSCKAFKPPKYLTTLDFEKSMFLFGEHMINRSRDTGIIVESPMSVLWLWQHGYQNAVATMGSIPSKHQFKKLSAWFHDIWVLADGDDWTLDAKGKKTIPPAGLRWGHELREGVARYMTAFRPHLCPKKKDPADLSREELASILGPPGGVRDDIRSTPKGGPGVQAKMNYWL